MFRFLVRRAVGLLPVLAVAVVLSFAANHATPGDPVVVMLGDQSANQELVAKLRREYGLDQPLWRQFVNYVAGLARGDLGLSFRYPGVPVRQVIADALAISPLLAIAAILIAFPIGVAAGVFAAVRAGSVPDTLLMLVLVAGLSVPNFAMAAFCVWAFALKLGWLPVAGWGTFKHAVLPVLLLSVPPIAYIGRLSRTFMLEVLSQDYMRTARAKGIGRRLVIWRHGLRNVLVPVLTVAGVILGGLVTSTFVVETIFNIPGLGRIAIDSIFARDYPVSTAIVLLFTAAYVTINLAVDALHMLIDPRVAREGT